MSTPRENPTSAWGEQEHSERDWPEGVEATACPGGPLLVRGATRWPPSEPTGPASVPVTRPVVAVCRCARSSRLPWCDGTHKVVPNPPDSSPPEGPAPPRP